MDPSTEPTFLSLAEVEKRAIREALVSSEGNVAEAAKLLGINKKLLWNKLGRMLPGVRVFIWLAEEVQHG